MSHFVEISRRYWRDMIGARLLSWSVISFMTAISCTSGQNLDKNRVFRGQHCLDYPRLVHHLENHSWNRNRVVLNGRLFTHALLWQKSLLHYRSAPPWMQNWGCDGQKSDKVAAMISIWFSLVSHAELVCTHNFWRYQTVKGCCFPRGHKFVGFCWVYETSY
jgi:hypothetical protein